MIHSFFKCEIKTFHVKCMVVLGDPRKDCAGFGICRVEKFSSHNFSQKLISGEIADLYFLRDNSLLMLFSSIPFKLKSFCLDKSFPVHTPFEISTDILPEGILAPRVIPIGKYPIISDDERVLIRFPLMQKAR